VTSDAFSLGYIRGTTTRACVVMETTESRGAWNSPSEREREKIRIFVTFSFVGRPASFISGRRDDDACSQINQINQIKTSFVSTTTRRRLTTGRRSTSEWELARVVDPQAGSVDRSIDRACARSVQKSLSLSEESASFHAPFPRDTARCPRGARTKIFDSIDAATTGRRELDVRTASLPFVHYFTITFLFPSVDGDVRGDRAR